MKKSRLLPFASILLPVALAAQLAPAAAAQAPEAHYRAFDSKGRAVKLSEIVDALEQADVLILGRNHMPGIAWATRQEVSERDRPHAHDELHKRPVPGCVAEPAASRVWVELRAERPSKLSPLDRKAGMDVPGWAASDRDRDSDRSKG